MKKTHIRPLKTSDSNELFQLIDSNRPRLIRYLPVTSKSNESLELTVNYLKELELKNRKKEIYVFAIIHQNIMVGMIFIKSIDWRNPKCELGYFIDQTHEGKGIMSAGLSMAIQYCFDDLGMNKLFLRTGVENTSSKSLALKMGFQLEGILRNDFRTELDELVDIAYYGKLKS